ncbi:MAG: ABC transporter ATP-binding protein [Lachnospiraceae bacterium]|nr:ABC transporter ATP-binding protein [Lachnospiraceae bacterium]
MKPENAIEVHNITKKFKVYLDKGKTLKERTLFSKRRKFENREVLKGISFEAKKGEAIGLIGHNGCGKSTTLKMLTKIMYPDSGTIEMNGRVSSLIELGAGFHPDMSGRDNIYINASIFGLTKKEIDERVNDIIEFSELEDFIDNPVRTYSSGMYMRLAFAVAINVDADILLIDEILAVGDVTFQAKCFNKLRKIKSDGTTIVIVSHSLNQLEMICDRTIWIHDGVIREEGSPFDVHPKYMSFMANNTLSRAKEEKKEEKKKEEAKKEITEAADHKPVNTEIEKEAEKPDTKQDDGKRWGSNEIVMTKVSVTDKDGVERNTFFNSEPVFVSIGYDNPGKIDKSVVGVAIYRDDKVHIYGTNTLIDTSKMLPLKDKGVITLAFDNIPVNAGNYIFDLAFHRPDGFNYDFWRGVFTLNITNAKGEVGVMSLSHSWESDAGK